MTDLTTIGEWLIAGMLFVFCLMYAAYRALALALEKGSAHANATKGNDRDAVEEGVQDGSRT